MDILYDASQVSAREERARRQEAQTALVGEEIMVFKKYQNTLSLLKSLRDAVARGLVQITKK